MATCAVCGQDLEEGYGFCHFCGAPAGQAVESQGPPKQELVELVDKFKEISSLSRSFAQGASGLLDRWLGSPVSVQRQLLYAILAGFTAFCWAPIPWGLSKWAQYSLAAMVVSFLVIRHWMTGGLSLSASLSPVVGSERSMRRRVILSFVPILVLAMLVLVGLRRVQYEGPADGGSELSEESEAPAADPPPGSIDSEVEPGEIVQYLMRGVAGSISFPVGLFLFTFYLMGFVSNWQRVADGSTWSRNGMADTADLVAGLLRKSMARRNIPEFTLTTIEMGRVHRYTGGLSSGRRGEQISFVRGSARVVVFVQDFGTGLFLRWIILNDAPGRRLWLLLGFLIRRVDQFAERWLGSSLVAGSRQISDALCPAAAHLLFFRSPNTGLTRALGLSIAISEYEQNEIEALSRAVDESVEEVVAAAGSGHEHAEAIRLRSERLARSEGRSEAAARAPRSGSR